MSAAIHHTGLPRRIRRGLIEARGRRGTSLSPGRAFRGEFAAASLKRGVGGPAAGGASGLPRRIRRGLIEASCSGSGPRTSPVTFRGEFAAASLKRLAGPAGEGRAAPSAANSPRPH